ncbi:Z1 domain-containing protein [Desulfobacterales bacterium HSG16]|nr:Z1 domain-containing protein [Desulfobacterales bacterium HSG16]
MEMTSYHRIKDHILTILQKHGGRLPADGISFEIQTTKNLIDMMGDKFVLVLPDKDNRLSSLSEDDWERMQREFETLFDVEMENGVLIQGENQQQRDSVWWSTLQKQKGENYYWERYKEYIKKSFSPEVVKTIDDNTDIIMDNIEDPSIGSFDRYGMVVGHVQSGKTANYSALVCKAADAGYKFIVIIAGGINNLRNQTQKRLNESFVGQDKGIQVGAGVGNTLRERLPVSLTTTERDFNKQDADRNAQSSNFDNISTPILIVIKKNTKTLSNVISWLEKQYKNQVTNHAMLMIDDESDYATINTKDEENPTAINKKLRKLLSLFYKSAYVAYTATPYANIFIDHKATDGDLGRDLFPRDFIFSLDAPTNYFGARSIFLNNGGRHLIPIDDYLDDIPPKHKKNFDLLSIPPSLYDAMRLFFLNVAIRHLRGQGYKHNSMLIHATRFTRIHQKLSIFVDDYISEVRKDVLSYGKMPDALLHSEIIRDLKATLDLQHPDINFQWNDIITKLCSIIDTILVREVHQSTGRPLEYRDDRPTNAIVIGGTSLSRGFTLEGLSVSYFLRNTVFYDTLMQMGRWFGYRPEYEDLCKIYTPQSIIDNFALIIEATEDLISDFKIMAEAKMTPNDFGLSVKQHPDSALQVTARNKQRNVQEFIFDMKLAGKSKETSWLSDKEEYLNHNLQAIRKIVSALPIHKRTPVANHFLWRNIDKETVMSFLADFKTYQKDPLGITARMPIEFVKKYVEDRNITWDVALYSGRGKEYEITDYISIKREERKLQRKNGHFEIRNRQISSGNAEAIALPEQKRRKIGSDRKATRREMSHPLLMLHILQTDEDDRLAAFGVSFPGSVLSKGETVSLKINTVYYQNLLEELRYEEEADD